MKRCKTVDEYLNQLDGWESEVHKLRDILVASSLEETIKWGAPCYVYEGKNVVGLLAFKTYFGLWFHQGALMSDPQGVLINAQEGKTKALRQWRMTSAKDIKVRTIKAYIKEAIELQAQGKEIKPERKKATLVPAELKEAFKRNRNAERAFKALTPGRQREYADYVSEAKREATRLSRTEKVLPMILDGTGLNDKYK
ncbi:MAG: YdeI/OmpD-associated family protein [Phycisphaerae bacterium]